MCGVVRADEEIRARGCELADILLEQPAHRVMIAAFVGVHHEVHRDAGERDFGMQVRPEPANALDAGFVIAQRCAFEAVGQNSDVLHA